MDAAAHAATQEADGVKLVRKPVLAGKETIDISVELGELSNEARELITGKIDNKGEDAKDMQTFGIIMLKGFVIEEAAEAYSQM